ncbi:Pyranose dehydrogenase 1 [Psilocybe cubensis]|uniref:pyranose dehydrogenase (acceptor) n=2 Tax=Psilocybe cubensis TaxID=181762 RepID=A0A8H7XV20_PSICU|nr:Pyranose dehydrogenase 1 [Psilocybe cubensis]KAH9476134.1 Pyranose dehydrogenase 1 [Psilocybe cubensis]
MHPHSIPLSTILLTILSSSFAATIAHSAELTTRTYDYIIVGAGTAGLVLASRLTEDPKITVLVLEAGGSDANNTAISTPFLAASLTPNTMVDWNYTVTPQVGMENRTFAYPRGRVLGGCSSVNYLFHQYGSDEDWNRLASLSDDPGWSWNNMKRYVQKHERFVPPVDGHNTTGQFIPSLHGFNGMVPVSLPGNNQSVDSRVLAATGQSGPKFTYNQDMSGGGHSLLGIGFLQSSAGGGVRSSSSTTYLAKADKRPNLTVLINSVVTKLVQTGNAHSGHKSFRSVEFSASPGTALSSTGPGNKPDTVTARREVILAAGAVNTPQILQLSGIGDSRDLHELEINAIIDNPSVGANLSDHTLLPNIFTVNPQHESGTFDGVLRDPIQLNARIVQWQTNKTGLLVNNIANNLGFLRVPSNNPIFKMIKDPAPGPKSPHWEMIVSNFFLSPGVPIPPSGGFMTIVNVLISPTSRGTVKLRSNNPFDKPLIDPNYLRTEFDIVTMRESVKSTLDFASAPAFADYISGRYGTAFQQATTDDTIDAYVRSLTTTIFHPFGTAAMSRRSAQFGVVNPDLTVKGADGLRIVDASVIPYVPSTHTQGPVYLLAERAADIIKESFHETG